MVIVQTLSHAHISDNAPTSTFDPAVLSALADLNLDAAFERATWPISDEMLSGLGGATTMNCTTGEGANAIETCEVNAQGVPAPIPASLAQH